MTTDWKEVGRRVERSRRALHDKQEGLDFKVLAHTDWCDEPVPTVIMWLTGPKAGETDSFLEDA